MTVQELYDFVKSVKMVKDTMTKNEMTRKLREIGIDFYASNGTNKYNIKHEELLEAGNKFQWFNSFDKEDYENMIKNHTIYKPDEEEAEEKKEFQEKDKYIYTPDEMSREIMSLKAKND